VAPRGEKAKSFNVYKRVMKELIDFGLTRKSMIIGFGGGSICDLAGFVASTYMRGVQLVLIPTTLMAQVDAAIGGKNGINFIGKNMIGTFYSPLKVIVDPTLLKTLNKKEYKSGLAEIVKYAVIAGEKFFRKLEENVEELTDPSSEILDEIIAESIQVKKGIVEKDCKEEGLRMVLNYGHTIGHALEKISGFRMRHGYAISIGMIVESFIAMKVLGLSKDVVFRIANLLKEFGLPIKLTATSKTLIDAMKYDKKFWYDKPLMALPYDIGHIELVNVDREVIEECLKKYV
jgi:3-dehydroquinate synthase